MIAGAPLLRPLLRDRSRVEVVPPSGTLTRSLPPRPAPAPPPASEPTPKPPE